MDNCKDCINDHYNHIKGKHCNGKNLMNLAGKQKEHTKLDEKGILQWCISFKKISDHVGVNNGIT